MPKVRIVNAEVVDFMRSYNGPRFHGALLDPPYGFNNGFMGEDWDKSSPVFREEFWRLMSGILHPAALGFCYMSAENSHRVSVAAEAGGISILPRHYLWVNGRSKPRYRRISNTHVYGKTAIKTSVEPVIAFQNGTDGTFADAIAQYRTGTYNIGGVEPSTDGRIRFPSSLVIDEYSAEVLEGEAPGRSAFFSVLSRVMSSPEVFYNDKAQRRERDFGLDEMPDVKVGVLEGRRNGTLGGDPIGKNNHPTVKPVLVSKHFGGLILPPDADEEVTLFAPFAGSGSDVVGALLGGWKSVLAVEINAEYCSMSEKRIVAFCSGTEVSVES
jgi:hypothetical protein